MRLSSVFIPAFSPRHEGRGNDEAFGPARFSGSAFLQSTGRGDQMNHGPLSKIITAATFLEIGAGLILVTAPAPVVNLLLGAQASNVEIALCRFFGIAIFALGMACRPFRRSDTSIPALRALLIYNSAIALCLLWLATAGQIHALLLWPAIVLHAGVALLLVWGWTRSRRY